MDPASFVQRSAPVTVLRTPIQFNSQGLIPGYLPSQPIAGLVLLSYILVLLGIAWALFVRRDIRSGSSQ